MLHLEHSAIFLTCIKRLLVFKTIFGLFKSGRCRQVLLYTHDGRRDRSKLKQHTPWFYALKCMVNGPLSHTGKPALSGHSKRTPKMVFNTDYHLMQVKSIAECSNASILQYFWPSLSFHLSLRPLLCLFLSGRLRQVLLYIQIPCHSYSENTITVAVLQLWKCLRWYRSNKAKHIILKCNNISFFCSKSISLSCLISVPEKPLRLVVKYYIFI